MKHRGWLIIGIAFGLIGAMIAGFGIFYGDFSARGYVESHYTRSRSNDIGRDAIAYTSRKQPSEVAADITKAWRPANNFVDGSGVYLRYDDDSVVIRPLATGSLILLERLATAYPRYHSTVGNAWGAGRGGSVRGGGPGSGK